MRKWVGEKNIQSPSCICSTVARSGKEKSDAAHQERLYPTSILHVLHGGVFSNFSTLFYSGWTTLWGKKCEAKYNTNTATQTWFGCSTTVFTAARLSYSRWQPGALKRKPTIHSSVPLFSPKMQDSYLPQVPYLHCTIFWTWIHPTPITRKTNCHNIIGMRIITHHLPFKFNKKATLGHQLEEAKRYATILVLRSKSYWLSVVWINVEQLNVRICCHSQISLVRGYLKPINLLLNEKERT